jgi:hypothetical protein
MHMSDPTTALRLGGHHHTCRSSVPTNAAADLNMLRHRHRRSGSSSS